MVIGGLVASTLVTLVLIPVAYTSMNSFVANIQARGWLRRRKPEPEEETAATT